MRKILILGGNGFIGHHMARKLHNEGHQVTAVDIKEYEYGQVDFCTFDIIADLRNQKSVYDIISHKNWDEIYCFACLMGGAGFVFTGENDSEIMSDSALININILRAIKEQGIKPKVFYSSSACMYPQEIQRISNNSGLKEIDAYPANPDSEYGWEKLFSERLYLAYARNYGLNVRIARFHNIYGIEGTYKGGKEKAPAAMCRKVAGVKELSYSDWRKEGNNKVSKLPIDKNYTSIEVWGDGQQTRSFLYIDECIEGITRLMNSDCKVPVNIGSDEMVSINDLAQMAIDISGKNIQIKNIESNALGVRGRNSDNDFIFSQLGWKPNYPLRKGMEKTFEWINQQVNEY